MTAKIPTIREYMTASPHAIGLDQPCSQAHAVLRKHQIRHLPVLQGGVLVGVISERDLHLLETLPDVDPAKVSVEEAMSSEVYAVSPETPLADVLHTMADRKYGCAVIMERNQVVGIFTTVDVCRGFASYLKK